MKQLTNQIAIVTGASSGIGAAIAKTFAKAGATVYNLDLNEQAGRAMAKDCQAAGLAVHFHSANVVEQTALQAIIADIADTHGRVDILISNAGIAHVGQLHTTSEADFDRLYLVNVKGVYNSMLAVIPHMLERQSGVIINLASIASTLGLPDRFAYSMTKGAVLTMTYSVARDYVQQGIRCNAISPARIHTPFVDNFIAQNYPGQEAQTFDRLSQTQPIGRMGTPEEVANLALFLCSDAAAFITGTNFPIDGGFIKLNT
ncbi:MAG: glucose 1-dehydrogenase [Bacteroidota bacterium]